ncbi:MAG: TatD family hydrolase [Oscillospiraceae bacterium]|jgi:TatD DNase family protein|nr:TatD family hydrolase [Oscillospiraceae bacterium]
MKLFDTHAHYDDSQFDHDRDELIASLPGQGVSLVLCPGCGMRSSRAVIALAERFPFVYAAVGIHPHEADTMTAAELPALLDMAEHPKVKAVGEIGLDYHYDFAPRDTQLFCLRAQMELAKSAGLPVIVHDREAHEDTLRLLRAFPTVRGVVHCYSGSMESAKELLALGYYISFTGVVTYKNARKALETAAWLPGERLLLETDAPYLTPEPHRSHRNDSTYLRLTCETLAALRGVSAEALAAQTRENGLALFNIKE